MLPRCQDAEEQRRLRAAQDLGFEAFAIELDEIRQRYDALGDERIESADRNMAAVNLGLRMAPYERAHVNLGVNSGPMGLCWLNERTRHATFRMVAEGAPEATPEYMRHLGYEIGGQLPQAKPWQRFVWEDDDVDVIAGEFGAVAALLDARAGGLWARSSSGGPVVARR